MDKLEQYIDQVCKSIGGPFDLRQHVRQELREHLLDAVAQHKAAGLAEADAVTKALEEFGKPDEVRTELESAYGQRTMWIVDKAMQWKERTMKAKWLWTTWAYLALASVIALEVMFLVFLAVFIVPKFWQLRSQGMINPTVFNEPEISWVPEMLDGVYRLAQGTYALMIALFVACAWGLFEWRVRSENKSFMRMSGLGTAAVGLTLVIVLTTGGMVVSFCQGMPQVGRLARPWAVEEIGNAETAAQALEDALAKKDWDAMELSSIRASYALGSLRNAAPAIPSLQGSPRPTVSELHNAVSSAFQSMNAAHQAILTRDAPAVEASLQKFRKAFEPLREAAKRPAR